MTGGEIDVIIGSESEAAQRGMVQVIDSLFLLPGSSGGKKERNRLWSKVSDDVYKRNCRSCAGTILNGRLESRV